MREICLSLADTREGEHFGQAGFYVKRKLFATCGDKHGVCEISFGLEADHAAALAERDPRFKLHPRDKRGVVVEVARVKNWREIKSLLLESYELVRPRAAPKKNASAARTRR
jgi:hypothetical protein